MFSILTCADTNFYPMARCLARNIRSYKDCRLFLYDLGLTAKEKVALERLGVTVEQTLYDSDTFSMNSKGNIRTTHKIDCIRHFLNKYGESVVALDADVLLVENCIKEFFPEEDEIVVTYRCNRERKSHIFINGKINAGVMGFGKKIGADFFDKWKRVCEDKEQTDQSALSQLLDGQVEWEKFGSRQRYGNNIVRVLDGNLYNDVSCRTGKVFHFKSAGRVLNKRIGFTFFIVMQQLFPKLVISAVRWNRKTSFFVWKGQRTCR